MPFSNPFSESQKLVRCEVLNRHGESSVRLVEFDAYKLWEYVMSHKHGLRVSDPVLCLWVSEEEYRDKAVIFDRTGEVEQVSRILVDLFDEEYGFAQTITRYARAEETARMLEILKAHMPCDGAGSEAGNIDVIRGRIVHQQHDYLRPAMMGMNS